MSVQSTKPESSPVGREDGRNGHRETQAGQPPDGHAGPHRAGVRHLPHQTHVLIQREVSSACCDLYPRPIFSYKGR